MFKQISDFEKFNIFVGNKNDFIKNGETENKNLEINNYEKELNCFIEIISDDHIDFKDMDLLLMRVLDKIEDKNVYIITNSINEFINYWIKGLVNYLI